MSCVIIPCRENFYLPAERIFTACRENFYSLPREIFFPAERVKKDRAHPIFGVIYIQGDISRQLAPKGQLSTAQGTALGIRKLRTMRPVRVALTFLCFFTVALTGRARWLFISVYPGRCPGLWKHWAFSPSLRKRYWSRPCANVIGHVLAHTLLVSCPCNVGGFTSLLIRKHILFVIFNIIQFQKLPVFVLE